MRRKTTRRKKRPAPRASAAANRRAQWAAFKKLEAEAHRAWKRIRADVRNCAPLSRVLNDQKRLVLILGECNYMARECNRIARRQKRR